MAAARRASLQRAGLALMLSLAAAPVFAQGSPQPQAQEDRPRRRTPQAPQPSASANAPGNTTGDARAGLGVPSRPGTPQRTTAGVSKPYVPPPPVLSSAIRSRYSAPALIARSTAGQCRAQCAEARGQCFNADSVDTSGCDPGWTRCLSTCESLTYSRGP